MYQDSMLKRQRSRNWNPVRCHYLTVEAVQPGLIYSTLSPELKLLNA